MKRLKLQKKNQTKILEMKTSVTKIKNWGFSWRLEQAEGTISERGNKWTEPRRTLRHNEEYHNTCNVNPKWKGEKEEAGRIVE